MAVEAISMDIQEPYAAAEWMNNRVQSLIARACGYLNYKRFMRDVCFLAGNLQLYPVRLQ